MEPWLARILDTNDGGNIAVSSTCLAMKLDLLGNAIELHCDVQAIVTAADDHHH
jgi:hypothetical protein